MTTSNLIRGVDVSAIQGTINWQSVADAGNEFMISRCCIGNSAGVDTFYKKNVAEANAVGIKTAAYQFAYPLPTIPSQPTRDPKVQAQMHVTGAAGLVSVVALDLEWPYPQNWSQWNCSAAQIVDWTITYLETYEQLSGIRPIVYSYPSFLQTINLPASFAETYKLWIASYTSNPVIPKPFTDYVVWQNSGGTQNLPGTKTPVDTDLARDLSLWGVQAVQPLPPPIPEVNTQPVPVAVVSAPEQPSVPTVVISTPAPGTTTVVSVASTQTPDPTQDPATDHPTLPPRGTTVSTIISDVEVALKNNPGIFSTIQNIIVKIAQKLLHI